MSSRGSCSRAGLSAGTTGRGVVVLSLMLLILLPLGCSDEDGVGRSSDSNGTDDPRADFESALDGMDFFFGNLHSHTGYFEGEGTPEEAFRWARDQVRFDFYAITDHAELLRRVEWQDTAEQADSFNQDGVFVALRGFEWGHPISGHVTVYGTEALTSAVRAPSLGLLYWWLDHRGGLAQFNHPGRPEGLFRNMEYEERVADNFFAVETGNKRDGNNTSRYLQHYPAFLDRGWRLAPTNNQDNHSLEANSHRTVIIGERLTRETVLDAMRLRRLYSSDDPNLRVVFKLGEAWMGSEVDTQEQVVVFTAIALDDEPIAQLELITNGGVTVRSTSFEDNQRIVSWSPAVEVFGEAYFYLKVTVVNEWDEEGDEQEQVAVTAPIWVKASDVP